MVRTSTLLSRIDWCGRVELGEWEVPFAEAWRPARLFFFGVIHALDSHR